MYDHDNDAIPGKNVRRHDMKTRLLHLFCAVFLLGVIIISAAAPVQAQNPPSLNEPMVYWGEIGPTVPGQDFDLSFLDRNGSKVSTLYEKDMPVTLVITTPPGFVNERLWCVVYYPPDKQVKNWIFQSGYFGNAGTFNLTTYMVNPGEPYGEYAFRVGLLSRPTYGGAMFWREKTVLLTVEKTPPLPPDIRAFTASTVAIQQGESATLAWQIDGATRITITPNVYDGTNAVGSVTVTPWESTIYTLTATNAAGESRTSSVTLSVLIPPPDDTWMLWALVGLVVVAIIAVILVFLFTRRKAALQPIAVTPAPSDTVIPGGTQVGGLLPTTVGPPGPGTMGTVIAGAVLVLADNSEIPLTTSTTQIGRRDFGSLSEEKGKYISRQHLTISHEYGNYYIEDPNSGNGTWLNGNDIRGKGKQQLRNGDQIDLARQTTITVRMA